MGKQQVKQETDSLFHYKAALLPDQRQQRFLRISKGGSRVLRFLLVEAAHTAIRKDAELRRFYQRLAERHGRPKAKVAVSRKLLIRAYIMLRDEIDYAEFQRRAVAARLARVYPGPPCPVP